MQTAGFDAAVQEPVRFEGVVIDENRIPLAGASVAVADDLSVGTITDVDGKFSISVPHGTVLVVSFFGYKDASVEAGDQGFMEIQLIPDAQVLKEVVVTALGISRETKSLGYAMQEIEAQRKQLHDRGMVCKWIFPNEKCQPFRQKAFRNRWYKYCETNQISAVTPYELRHTFVSICDEMPDGLKKQVVGHSRNMDTNGIYGHRKTGDLERAAAYSDAAFRAIL